MGQSPEVQSSHGRGLLSFPRVGVQSEACRVERVFEVIVSMAFPESGLVKRVYVL